MEDINYKTALGLLLKSMHDDYEGQKTRNHELLLTLGQTPQVLLNVGMPQLPLAITGKVLDKVYFDHGISKGMLERIYSIIDTPKAVYRAHQNQPGSVVMTYEIKDSKPVIIAIHPNRKMARNAFFNVVASMYPKAANNGESIEDRWTREGLLLWKAPTVSTAITAPVVALKIANKK